MGWYRLAFYPMPLANHHELLKDYFRLFHKHNPEHAMKTITYIETFSVENTWCDVHFPELELSTLCFFSKTKVEVNVFFLCC